MVPDNYRVGDPYHGLRQDVSDCQHFTEVLEKTGLSTPVEYDPIFFQDTDGVYKQLEGFKHPRRGDERIPAVLQDSYTHLGDDTILESLQLFVDQGAKWGSVLVTQQTAHVIAELLLPSEQFAIERFNGETDRFDATILSLWSHNGLKSWVGVFNSVRAWCMNQFMAMLREARQRDEGWFKFRHTKNIGMKVPTAQRIMAEAIGAFGGQQQSMQLLANTNMDKVGFVDFCAQLLTGKNDPREAHKEIAELKEGRSRSMMEHKFDVLSHLYLNGKGNFGHDCLDAFNAVTEWCDHARGSRADEDQLVVESLARRRDNVVPMRPQTDIVLTTAEQNKLEKRLNANLYGTGADLKARAFRLLTERAQALAA